MRNLCTTLHTEELLKIWASCCVVDLPLTFSYERIPEEKLHRTGDHHNELKTGGGGAHEAEAGLQSQNTNQGTADHGGTEIHVGLLNNDHHQPGFVLAFSTNYCSTGRHSSLWRQKHRLCKEQRRGLCVYSNANWCTNRQTPLITALTLWSVHGCHCCNCVCAIEDYTATALFLYNSVTIKHMWYFSNNPRAPGMSAFTLPGPTWGEPPQMQR